MMSNKLCTNANKATYPESKALYGGTHPSSWTKELPETFCSVTNLLAARKRTKPKRKCREGVPNFVEPVGKSGILKIGSRCHHKMVARGAWAIHKILGGSKLSIFVQGRQLFPSGCSL